MSPAPSGRLNLKVILPRRLAVEGDVQEVQLPSCLLYTSPSPRDCS